MSDENKAKEIQQKMGNTQDMFRLTVEQEQESESLLDLDPLQLYFGEDYVINDKIKIRQPTIGDILEYGEANVYGAAGPFITNPTTHRVELWKAGIDWNKIDDYSFFMMQIQTIDPNYSPILFRDIDFSQFLPSVTERDGVEVPTLYNAVQDIEIDEPTFIHMCKYLQYMFNATPKVEHIKGSKNTKYEVICEDIMLRKKNKKIESQSSLLPMISFCLNHPGFKYKKSELKEVGIVEFMDSVKRLQIYESTNALMKGAYSGFMDTSKIDKNEFNFMRDVG